jgi:hypothetical protein
LARYCTRLGSFVHKEKLLIKFILQKQSFKVENFVC